MMSKTWIAHFRHAKYYYSLVSVQELNFWIVDSELPQIQQALEWLTTQSKKETITLFLRYLVSIQNYYNRRSMYEDILKHCDYLLQIRTKFQINLGIVLNIKYNALFALGRWQDAHNTVQQALEVTHVSQPKQYALATYNLGRLQMNQGNYAKALHKLREAERLFSNFGMFIELADAKAEIAAYQLNQRNLDEALRLFLEVDRIRKRANESKVSGHTLLMLGVIYRKRGQYIDSISYLTELKSTGIKYKDQAAVATWVHFNILAE